MQQFKHLQDEHSLKASDDFYYSCLRTDDGGNFKVHRKRLADSNCYFRALFFGGFRDEADIFLKGLDSKTLRNILSFLDSGKFRLNQRNLAAMLFATDYLQVEVLWRVCRDYAIETMSPRNCLRLFTTAWKIGNESFFRVCKRYVQTHFEEAVEKTKGMAIGDMPLDALKNLLNDRNLNVTSEDVVWRVIVQWVTREHTLVRQSAVPKLLGYVSRMEVDNDLADDILSHPIVRANLYCKDWWVDNLPDIRNSSLFLQAMLSFETRLDGLRIPQRLHFLAYCRPDESLIVYLTYDDQLDLVRAVGRFKFRPDSIVKSGNAVYLFDTWQNDILGFDLRAELWFPVKPLTLSRSGYCVVAVGEDVYVLGGVEGNVQATDTVQRYSPSSGASDTVCQMLPMVLFEAVVLNGCIYAIGDVSAGPKTTMTVQVYSPKSNAWSRIAAPERIRHDFAAVVYRGRIYVVGGADSRKVLKTVEVYDPAEGKWGSLPDLPVAYIQPKAVVIGNEMMVYENIPSAHRLRHGVPPVRWNAREKAWEVLRESSPWFRIHLYNFCCLDDPEIIKRITMKNRRKGVVWNKNDLV